MRWQGGKDLAESAEFTSEFCTALLNCWENRDAANADAQKPKNTRAKRSRAPVIEINTDSEAL